METDIEVCCDKVSGCDERKVDEIGNLVGGQQVDGKEARLND